MQIKATISYHFTPEILSLLKRTADIVEDIKKKGVSFTLGRECQLIQIFWKTLWSLLKKLAIELPYVS